MPGATGVKLPAPRAIRKGKSRRDRKPTMADGAPHRQLTGGRKTIKYRLIATTAPA
jgi:hypothetical protein